MLDEKTTSSSCVSLKRPVSPSSPSSVQVVGNGTNPHEGKEERSSQPKYVKTAGQAHPMLPAVHQPAPSPPPLPPPPPPPVESSRTARAKKALTEGGPQEWMAFLERTFAAARSSTLQPDIQSSLDELVALAESLSLAWIRTASAGTRTFAEGLKLDVLSCPKCGGVLQQAVTLNCGHSVCRKCCGTSSSSSAEAMARPVYSCAKCGRNQLDEPKTSVGVSNLVDKWWPKELQAVELRTAGNAAFARQELPAALAKYTEAVQAAPEDFTALSNRSNVLHKMGRLEEALKDADQVVRLRPDWPKGYFRQAAAFRALGRHEEALFALLGCAAAERDLPVDIRDDMAQDLWRIVSSMAKKSVSPVRPPADYSESGSEDSASSAEDVLPAVVVLPQPRSHTGTDQSSDTDAEAHAIRSRSSPVHLPPEELRLFLDRILDRLDRFKRREVTLKVRSVDPSKVDPADFECSLCCRLLWQPVTTPCGHAFCRTCLDRCMDHNPACPLCKTSLAEYLAERRQSLTEFLDSAMALYLPTDYADRSKAHDDEMKELASSDRLPIFVCTMAYPTVPCPLHVFEPRYRLMIRRAMESGSRQFGMCAAVQGGFAQFGTVLEVRDVEFFTDGRSVVDTVGVKRFKVLSRGVLDGYATAQVEYLADDVVEPGSERAGTLKALHDSVREAASTWVESGAPSQLRQRIRQHYGTMPALEPDWMSLPNGPAWLWWMIPILPLETNAQVAILSMTRLEKRLEAVKRGLEHVQQRFR